MYTNLVRRLDMEQCGQDPAQGEVLLDLGARQPGDVLPPLRDAVRRDHRPGSTSESMRSFQRSFRGASLRSPPGIDEAVSVARFGRAEGFGRGRKVLADSQVQRRQRFEKRVAPFARRQLMEAKRRQQAEDATRDPLGDVCEGMFGGDGVLFRAAEEGPFSGERHDPAGAAASDLWT